MIENGYVQTTEKMLKKFPKINQRHFSNILTDEKNRLTISYQKEKLLFYYKQNMTN